MNDDYCENINANNVKRVIVKESGDSTTSSESEALNTAHDLFVSSMTHGQMASNLLTADDDDNNGEESGINLRNRFSFRSFRRGRSLSKSRLNNNNNSNLPSPTTEGPPGKCSGGGVAGKNRCSGLASYGSRANVEMLSSSCNNI